VALVSEECHLTSFVVGKTALLAIELIEQMKVAVVGTLAS
jgi:hypothetical protein